MPAPGASTFSAIVVGFATLSSWCVWQRNCVEEVVVEPEPQFLGVDEIFKIGTQIGEAWEELFQATELSAAEAQTNYKRSQLKRMQLKRGAGTWIEASPMVNDTYVIEPVQCSGQVFLNGIDHMITSRAAQPRTFDAIKDIVSSLDVNTKTTSMHKIPTLNGSSASRFSGIDKIVSPLSVKVGAMPASRNVHQQGTLSGPSFQPSKGFSAGFLGLAVVLDLCLAGACMTLLRSRFTTSSEEKIICVSRPAFEQALAPLPQDALEFPNDGICTLDGSRQVQIDAAIDASAQNRKRCEQSPVQQSSDNELQTQINSIVGMHAEHRKQPFIAPCSSSDQLKAQINAIVGAHIEHRKQCEQSDAAWSSNEAWSSNDSFEAELSAAVQWTSSGDELQAQINSIVGAHLWKHQQSAETPTASSTKDLEAHINAIIDGHKEHRKQSEQYVFQQNVAMALNGAAERKQQRLSGASQPAADLTELASPSPAKSLSDNELQCRANLALSASKQSRLSAAELASPSPAKSLSDMELQYQANLALSAAKKKRPSAAELASPSPAKSVSDIDLQYHVHLALSAAKERTTPAKAPEGPEPSHVHWEAYQEDDVAPCQLSFDADVETEETESGKSQTVTAPAPGLLLSDNELQCRVNLALSASKQKRLSAAELASPSPAKSLSDMELQYQANLALAAAKERTTPAKAPESSHAHWEACQEDDVAPCQLSFAADTETEETESGKNQTVTAPAPGLSLSCAVADEEEATDVSKGLPAPFDVSQIPSPTRSRAKKQQLLEDDQGDTQQTPAKSIDGSPTALSRMIEGSPTGSNMRSKLQSRSSPLHGAAICRMLQNSATPTKQAGAHLEPRAPWGRRSLSNVVTHVDEDVPPELSPFMYQ